MMTRTDTTRSTIDATPPRVIAERCVHTRLAHASCQRCIDVCPVEAWVLEDDAMGIDASRCDGCGLCAAACPQGAIISDGVAQALASPDAYTLNFACEYAGVEAEQGIIACLHAIGLHELLRLYRNGARVMNVACGDCTHCSRRCTRSLCDRLEALNNMLRNRNMDVLRLQVIPAEQWKPALPVKTRSSDVPVLNRRNFFHRVAASSVKLARDIHGGQQEQRFIPPGKLLPRRHADAIVPYVPTIDARRCIGCDACARLCPQGAIALYSGEDLMQYRIDAERCTGCAICLDVCAQQAVNVDSWRSQRQFTLDLTAGYCDACGVPYHVPADQNNHQSLCVICAKKNHARDLYQVFEEPG